MDLKIKIRRPVAFVKWRALDLQLRGVSRRIRERSSLLLFPLFSSRRSRIENRVNLSEYE